MVTTINHEHHRYRRSLLNNFFSKQSVMKLEGLIQEKIEQAIHRLQEVYSEGGVISLDALYAALTVDVISHYAYGKEPRNSG
jgi:cytochrome P450